VQCTFIYRYMRIRMFVLQGEDQAIQTRHFNAVNSRFITINTLNISVTTTHFYNLFPVISETLGTSFSTFAPHSQNCNKIQHSCPNSNSMPASPPYFLHGNLINPALKITQLMPFSSVHDHCRFGGTYCRGTASKHTASS
jgi:hypothetical protein